MNSSFKRRTSCALCSAGSNELVQVLSLAPTPPANEFVKEEELALPQEAIPLTLLLCRICGHVQLAEIVDPGRLFRNYVYVSGTSPVFVSHFNRYAANAIERFGLGSSSFVMDVGSNDGTLLKQFRMQGVGKVLGIDPASDIAKAARESGIPTLEAFLNPELAGEIVASSGTADLICANNVFAHAEDLRGFAEAVHLLLAERGVFVFEVSYIVDVVQKLLFDTIYHEHLAYHSVTPLIRFFSSLGLRLFDAERIDTHGGSLRCYVCQSAAKYDNSGRLAELVRLERELGLAEPDVYRKFKERISARGEQLRSRLKEIQQKGQRVAGFGAPAKLTPLMYEFAINSSHIDFVIDDSAWKQGLFTPGTHIRVVPSAELYQRRPDYCIVFAWNFAESIMAKHTAYTDAGGHFLVPLPELREI